MRTLLLLVVVQLVSICMFAVPVSEFYEPWQDPTKAIVIDPFEKNDINWESLATDSRVAGIVHRSSIGLRKDKKYAMQRAEAKSRGYKWGSYHLGLPGDPIEQANFYLGVIAPWDGEIMALDIETLDSTKSMALKDAALFIKEIRRRTGRDPLLYANDTVAREISNHQIETEVFSHTGLWYARFRRDIPNFPNGMWNKYTLWQFSSELNCKKGRESVCLYRVPGTAYDMDVNVYDGTVEECKKAWPLH